MWWMFACAAEVEPVRSPDTHSWKEEADLVVVGLQEVESLWVAHQREAARVLAERVYTERWEPQLEPALRQFGGPEEAIKMEYRFGILMQDLKGNPSPAALAARFEKLEQDVRDVGEQATRAFPPPGQAPSAPVDPSAPPSKPSVPDLRPAWEDGDLDDAAVPGVEGGDR